MQWIKVTERFPMPSIDKDVVGKSKRGHLDIYSWDNMVQFYRPYIYEADELFEWFDFDEDAIPPGNQDELWNETEERKEKMEKYHSLQNKLIQLISETNNEELMNAYLDWQDIRNELNAEWLEYIESFIPKNDESKMG